MTRILVAEDQATVRDALVMLLSLEEDLEVIAEASDGAEAVARAVSSRPDVALVDVEMPGKDGLEAAAEIRRRLPSCKVAILTTFGRTGYLRRALEGGATGFLLKEAPASELADAVRRVAAGERVVEPELAMAALSDGPNPLTAREREVLSASSGGASVSDVAATLHLAQGTVKNHLSSAAKKLGARNRVEAARFAEEKGWLL